MQAIDSTNGAIGGHENTLSHTFGNKGKLRMGGNDVTGYGQSVGKNQYRLAAVFQGTGDV